MKLRVNKDKCISCGQCVMTCEEVFAFGDDCKAEVIVDTIPKDKEIVAEEVLKEVCPTKAVEEA